MRRSIRLFAFIAGCALAVVPMSTRPAEAASKGDTLTRGSELKAGESLSSRNGQYGVRMQADGNLVVFNGRKPIWASNTAAVGRATAQRSRVQLRDDGNLVIYSGVPGHRGADTSVWASGTVGRISTRLTIQNDGNLVLYAIGDYPVWSSRGSLAGNPSFNLPEELRVLTFNMCQDYCSFKASRKEKNNWIAVTDDLQRSVTKRSPQIVTLQEVCRSQFARLQNGLSSMGYRGFFAATDPKAKCQDTSDFGIATFVHTSEAIEIVNELLPNPGNDELRRVMCVAVSLRRGFRPFVTCNTHIDYNPENPESQITRVKDIAERYESENSTILSGDFNVTPDTASLDSVYSDEYFHGHGRFREVATNKRGSSIVPRFGDNTNCLFYDCPHVSLNPLNENPRIRKIDYVFVSQRMKSPKEDLEYAPHSDHLPVWAVVAGG